MRTFTAVLAIVFATLGVLIDHVIEEAVAVIPLPGVQGPFLGDQNANMYNLVQAITLNNQLGFSSGINAANAASQANCVPITQPINQVNASVSTGSLCLPPAAPGRVVWISNTTANGLNLYGSNTPNVPGTQDTINGTTGSTANTTVLPAASANKTSICLANAVGAWNCSVAD